MPTTRTPQGRRELDDRLGADLPSLTMLDRLALRLGLELIQWGQRNRIRPTSLAVDRREAARRDRTADRMCHDRDTAFERRSHAGPTW